MPVKDISADIKVKEGKNFHVKVFIDHINQRIKVLDYEGTNIPALARYLKGLCENENFGKIILIGREDDWEAFISRGYVLEGILKNYFCGKTGYCLSRFFGKNRRFSQSIEEEDEILEKILNTPPDSLLKPLPEGYVIRTAGQQDIPGLVNLFKKVFSTYPTPLDSREYLEKVMEGKTLFKIIENEENILSAASADMNKAYMAAEITDCATIPEYRGQGFMAHLIKALENEMKKKQMITLYSLSRALSHGINLLFYRNGYHFSGRLINNCNIMGRYEDMNLWVKTFLSH